MLKVERHLVKKTDSRWETIDNLCFLSKNLYNASLFDRRQHFFATGKSKTYSTQAKEFKNNPDYCALPRKVSQQIMRKVEHNFSSFYSLLRKKRNKEYDAQVRLPKYLPKNDRNIVIFPVDTISKKGKDGEIVVCPTSVNLIFKTKVQDPREVRIIHRGGHAVVEITYHVEDVEPRKDNKRYASLDFNIDNIALYSNTSEPVLFNLKPLKSINQFYNKRRARISAGLPKGVKWSNRLQKLTDKRNRRMEWETHNVSRQIMNYIVSGNINTLIIGQNKKWKQGINLGKRNNQSFVSMPFYKIIQQLQYKCRELGINVIMTEESYTSKCSFLDREPVKKHDTYLGKRTKRRVFRASDGRIIHADINAAGNIMRKVVSDDLAYVRTDEIVGGRNPRKITVRKDLLKSNNM